VSPLQAIARHPFIAILPVLLGLGVALAIGLTRPPVYTAQSRLGIVNVDVSAPGALGAFGNGAAELAQAYARTLSVPELRAAVAKRTGLREDQLDGRLSASAVANAPIFAVENSVRKARKGRPEISTAALVIVSSMARSSEA